jgi:hypothetical protein
MYYIIYFDMSNQIYSNLETRSRYLEPKPEFFVQLNSDLVIPTSAGYTETLIGFNENAQTDTGYIVWDSIQSEVVCESEGVFTVQASVSYFGASASESVELFFLINGAAIPNYGISVLPRFLTTIAGSEASVISTSYTFKGVPGTTIQTRIKSQAQITVQGVNHSPSKRTYLTCTKIN